VPAAKKQGMWWRTDAILCASAPVFLVGGGGHTLIAFAPWAPRTLVTPLFRSCTRLLKTGYPADTSDVRPWLWRGALVLNAAALALACGSSPWFGFG